MDLNFFRYYDFLLSIDWYPYRHIRRHTKSFCISCTLFKFYPDFFTTLVYVSKWLITAAHCIVGTEYNAYLGLHNIANDTIDNLNGATVLIKAQSVIPVNKTN